MPLLWERTADGAGPLVDVLTVERYAARTRFFFDKQSGLLIGSDTERDEDVDPCELRFEGLLELDQRRLPRLIIVRHGDREYGRYELRQAAFSAT